MSDLHIMKIKGSGFLNLKTVDLELEDGVIRIAGENRAGKSNLLKLIKLLAGKKEMPEIPKTQGQKKGKFEIQLGDKEKQVKYLVTYSFTEKNSYISVEDPEGEKVGLEVLQDMLSPCIDPWTFFQNATAEGTGAKARRAKAVELLKELMVVSYDPTELLESIGVAEDQHIKSLLSQHKDDTLSFLNALEQTFVENRALWNDKVKKLSGSIAVLKKDIPPEDRNVQSVDIEALFAEQRVMMAVQERSRKHEAECERLRKEVHAVEIKLESAKSRLKEEEAKDVPMIDEEALDTLTKRISSVSETNEKARKAATLKKQETELEAAQCRAESKTEAVTAIRDAKLEAMESASMPIDGLSVDDGNITKHGIPLGQDSHEEGLTDSFMIGLAKFNMMNDGDDKLKTLLLPDASLLGKKATDRLIALADQHGIQLVMELVMDEKQSGVIFVEEGVAVNV